MSFILTSRRTAAAAVAGFTLIEVLLSLTVIALLVGAVSFGVIGGIATERLDEGADRMTTAMRLTRIEAITRAKRFRIEIDPQGLPTVTWEPEPLVEPGAFVPYEGSMWAKSLPVTMVWVQESKRDDSDAYIPGDQPAGTDGMNDESPLDHLTFGPDGTFDTALLELRSTDERDKRVAIVRLDGFNALFEYQILVPSAYEEYRIAMEAVDDN